MMILFHKNFYKDLKSLDNKMRSKTIERIELFSTDQFSLILNNHALKGKYEGYRSINITGDVRAVYKNTDEDVALFVAIGTHSALYT